MVIRAVLVSIYKESGNEWFIRAVLVSILKGKINGLYQSCHSVSISRRK